MISNFRSASVLSSRWDTFEITYNLHYKQEVVNCKRYPSWYWPWRNSSKMSQPGEDAAWSKANVAWGCHDVGYTMQDCEGLICFQKLTIIMNSSPMNLGLPWITRWRKDFLLVLTFGMAEMTLIKWTLLIERRVLIKRRAMRALPKDIQ